MIQFNPVSTLLLANSEDDMVKRWRFGRSRWMRMDQEYLLADLSYGISKPTREWRTCHICYGEISKDEYHVVVQNETGTYYGHLRCYCNTISIEE